MRNNDGVSGSPFNLEKDIDRGSVPGLRLLHLMAGNARVRSRCCRSSPARVTSSSTRASTDEVKRGKLREEDLSSRVRGRGREKEIGARVRWRTSRRAISLSDSSGAGVFLQE